MKLLRVKTNEYEENLIGVKNFKETWTKIENWQISFLVYKMDQNIFEYNLVTNESSIVFDGQEYVIKNCELASTGMVEVKQVEATHISYNIQDHTQDTVNEGRKTYSIEEVLNFGLSENQLGFSYKVIGSFDKVQIENLGDMDGLETVNKVCKSYNAVMIPDNKELYFYREDSWTTLTQNQFRDGYNTYGMTISIDTTNLKTAVRGFGMKKEDESWFFEPFAYISPEASKWNNGKPKWMKAIRDETINNPATMLEKMKRELVDYPEVSLSTNTIEIGEFGKGDVWTYINDQQQIVTDVTITGYTRYPFDSKMTSEVIFSNTKKAMTDIQGDISRVAKNSARQLSNAGTLVANNIPSSIKTASADVNKTNKAIEFLESGLKSKWNEQDVKDYYG